MGSVQSAECRVQSAECRVHHKSSVNANCRIFVGDLNFMTTLEQPTYIFVRALVIKYLFVLFGETILYLLRIWSSISKYYMINGIHVFVCGLCIAQMHSNSVFAVKRSGRIATMPEIETRNISQDPLWKYLQNTVSPKA